MIELSASDFSISPPQIAIREWWQALINIEATFCITIGKIQMIQEPHFCVVELVNALRCWEASSNYLSDFEYESMNEEETELLWFQLTSEDRWLVGSAWQQTECPDPVSTQALKTAIHIFNKSVEQSVANDLGVYLMDFKEFAA
ncbi:hypothetical protein [Acaryochloris sp. CCMEE 5410]|uniref:DUF7878 domain-containing protein n=1 Tax=Acaryochloris sp. CCMEE 5410 TaxID=310037 RepID=UPI00024846B8|nr:hypothetical protein [Acaryochloris sp. CCMEE 5410]KAI9131311.1 hypothetical protein ON05_027105 [Acaryochloris sp. CCMEE 5410]